MKHTPGPWKWRKSLQGGMFIQGNLNGESFDTVLDTQNDVYSGDQMLIAAAPDLLEACKMAQVRIMMLKGNQNETYQQLGQAIDKAEGK